uniref:Uncharacterized protein n=1 Tax=Romanomermis culicivorax TaxID=13658 RepID=A0A915IKL3_ROMCU
MQKNGNDQNDQHTQRAMRQTFAIRICKPSCCHSVGINHTHYSIHKLAKNYQAAQVPDVLVEKSKNGHIDQSFGSSTHVFCLPLLINMTDNGDKNKINVILTQALAISIFMVVERRISAVIMTNLSSPS